MKQIRKKLLKKYAKGEVLEDKQKARMKGWRQIAKKKGKVKKVKEEEYVGDIKTERTREKEKVWDKYYRNGEIRTKANVLLSFSSLTRFSSY